MVRIYYVYGAVSTDKSAFADVLCEWVYLQNGIHSYRYLGRKIKQTDGRLTKIKPPDTINHLPQGIKTWKHWKGLFIFRGFTHLALSIGSSFHLQPLNTELFFSTVCQSHSMEFCRIVFLFMFYYCTINVHWKGVLLCLLYIYVYICCTLSHKCKFTLLTQNIAHAEFKCGQNIEETRLRNKRARKRREILHRTAIHIFPHPFIYTCPFIARDWIQEYLKEHQVVQWYIIFYHNLHMDTC